MTVHTVILTFSAPFVYYILILGTQLLIDKSRLKVGKNLITNRLKILNDKIELDGMNSIFEG